MPCSFRWRLHNERVGLRIVVSDAVRLEIIGPDTRRSEGLAVPVCSEVIHSIIVQKP
ncbi:MAG: hypothetical protein LZF62_480168 [Nitrospira sp.]|nr:MAG: hypothetical protein LZF62_480168 [Nitrospira sp.]